ncbi:MULTISPECIES: DNA primase catalytic subunit PriS [unclassified Methanoregula]|uniref:DNA primase catalytic subunit PriS n=1 Tax=unclassified Methanoregula TaxID=2649730 RepID=UPI0009C924A0|nr:MULTISPECIES: DNA primase catalytic subunit PriS [unclassified Methanoregula]OPX63362.1 MAG: DNA primase small subunit PriS [Methanoregula sp. PtaB.Bin085]OPY35034.1 MAG: DNA primase small subunit PriS [Methanoregula sp. PtaU1.Bin006]
MNPATTEFLRQRFTEYYKKAVLVPPPSLPQREWGFILFNPAGGDTHMRRHIGFSGREEMADYIRNLVPQHTYFSTAYYEKPDAGTMADKGWCGADLIFDLDADHIVRGPYDQMLARVKEETEKLLSILTEEFGMDKKAIALVFSGGRGYHVHVRDLAFRSWGSSERRELIDYVCGIGIDPAAMLAGKNVPSTGWHRRYREALLGYLRWIGSLPEEEAMAHLTAMEGIGKESATQFLKKREEIISDIENRPSGMIMKNRVLGIITGQQEGEFRKRLNEQAALADEPVTTDTKRLIRMPASLHGGSGMLVRALELRDLHDFDPLTDAVVFGTRDVKVDQRFPVKMPMLGSTYELKKGINTVPEAVAVFLCCRGMAEIA